ALRRLHDAGKRNSVRPLIGEEERSCVICRKGQPRPRMRLGHLPQLIRRTIGSSKRRLGALSRPLAAEADSQSFKGGCAWATFGCRVLYGVPGADVLAR